MKYEDQLYYKSKEVANNLERIAKISPEKTLPIIKSDKKYFWWTERHKSVDCEDERDAKAINV